MQPEIILAVLDEQRRQVYEKFLVNERASFRTVSSLREVVIQAAQHPHKGILLDMPIVVKASTYEKNLVENTLLALPSARINISKESCEILVLAIGAENGTHSTASEFISQCRNTPSKIVFARNRIPLHLNVLLALTPDMSDSVMTCCIDCSEGGCFLFATDETLVPDISVWIKFVGFHDQTPIQATICWKRPWGQYDKVPGIGVRFDTLTNSQLSELIERTKQRSDKSSHKKHF